MGRKPAKQEVALTSDTKPGYLQAMEQKGAAQPQDNFDSSDVVVPRIKLLQGLSKECEEFDTAKAGVFWHTGFDVAVGTELNFVICSRKKKYMLVAPLEDGQGILARAENFFEWDVTGSWDVKLKGQKTPVTWTISDLNVQQSGLDKWGTYDPDNLNSPPAATLFYEYLVLLPDHLDWGPAVISMTRSQIRKAKKGINDKIELHRAAGRPMQALVFLAKPTNDTNSDGQDFKNWAVQSNGFASEELFAMANELRTALSSYVIQNEEEVVGDESRGEAAAESDKY
jgi:hypothetical protein